jgi:hypothetical protein
MTQALQVVLIALFGCALVSLGQPVHFVVGPYGGRLVDGLTNSFVIPLTDPSDIANERYRSATVDRDDVFYYMPYTRTESHPLLDIQLGSDGINRDFFTAGQPLWSWHVRAVVGWTGAYIPEQPYHHPWELERDVLAGTITNGSVVFFANAYIPISELTDDLRLRVWRPPPSPSYYYTSEAGSYFYWTHGVLEDLWNPGTSERVYSLEWSATLSPPQWFTVPEVVSGITTNSAYRVSSRMFWIDDGVLPNGYLRLREQSGGQQAVPPNAG